MPDDLDSKVQAVSVSEDLPFSHGFLPRAELSGLLEKVGDFLIRKDRRSGRDATFTVLSVRTSLESPNAIRHIIIHKRKTEDGASQWLIHNDDRFDTIEQLIQFYMRTKKPINPKVKASVLLRGIGRRWWELTRENIILGQCIATGKYGEVYSGKVRIRSDWTPTNIKLAHRWNRSKQTEEFKNWIKECENEVHVMRYLNHPNVLKTYGLAASEEPLLFLFELLPNAVTLASALRSRKGQIRTDEKICNMCMGVALALEYIHSMRCIHRDIQSNSVLYTIQKVIKLSDFGLAVFGDEFVLRSKQKLPIRWTAPEALLNFKFTKQSDVYAFSILVFEVFIEGEDPYVGMSSTEVKRMVLEGRRLGKPEDCPDEVFKLIECCWGQNPAGRFTMAEVVGSLRHYITERRRKQALRVGKSSKASAKEVSIWQEPVVITAFGKEATAMTGSEVSGTQADFENATLRASSLNRKGKQMIRVGQSRKSWLEGVKRRMAKKSKKRRMKGAH